MARLDLQIYPCVGSSAKCPASRSVSSLDPVLHWNAVMNYTVLCFKTLSRFPSCTQAHISLSDMVL